MNNSVIAICGPQGSGKSTLAEALWNHLGGDDSVRFGIKSCFAPYELSVVNQMISDELLLTYPPIRAQKELQKAISTWAEMHIDPKIWSRKFAYKVNSLYRDHVVITDDIRTDMNFEALKELAAGGRHVLLVDLGASETVRRKRLGNLFRDTSSYTEKVQVPTWWGSVPNTEYFAFNTESFTTGDMVKQIVSKLSATGNDEEHA